METQQQRKRKHLTEEQKEIMISFMEANGDICSSTFLSSQGKEKKQKLTEQLTHSLNSCETGVIRSPKEWLKSWNDNKNKTKSKAAYLSRYRRLNGGDSPSDITPLTPWEERIMGVIPSELVERNNTVEPAENEVSETKEQHAPTEFLEITMVPSNAEPEKDTLEAGPSGQTSEYELTDHDYHLKRDESSRESTPTKEPRRRKKRTRKLSNSSPKDEKFERLMQAFIKVQQENNAAILQLAASFKEGCKYIADSCNNIAAAYSKKE